MNDSNYQPSGLFTNNGSDCLDGSRAVWVFYSEDTLAAKEDHYFMAEDRVYLRVSLSWNILWKAAFFGKLQMGRPILLLFPLWPEGEHFQPVAPREDLWVCRVCALFLFIKWAEHQKQLLLSSHHHQGTSDGQETSRRIPESGHGRKDGQRKQRDNEKWWSQRQ